jgi:nucleotide-binding universal stress UspA family protein
VSAAAEPPDPTSLEVEAVLLASESRPITREAVAMAVRIAKRSDASVHVLTIARIWGSSLGFPNPGLYPNKHEWDAQRAIVDETVAALERAGVKADGHVIGARNATKRIVREATHKGCGAIVMAADASRGRFAGNFMWSQEPQRVQRRAAVPVYLVTGREHP